MKKNLLFFCLIVLCLDLFSQPVLPYTYSYTLTTGSPVFHRPSDNNNPPNSLSTWGTAVYYTTFTFKPSVTGSYTFTNTSATTDGYGFIYKSPFNPASPLTNVLIGDDDGGVGAADNDYLITITLTAGVSYTLVSTTYDNGDTGSGTTIITGPTGAMLPITWLHAGGLVNQQSKAVISWEVDENQVAWYELEKSSNGIDFTSVSRVESKGDGVHKYSITDPNPMTTTTYYRILHQDINGKNSYSRTIQLKVVSKGITIYPNPAGREQIQVSVEQGLLNTDMKLINLNGQVLKTIRIQQSNFSINLNKYMPGIYFLQFENGDREKLVVQ